MRLVALGAFPGRPDEYGSAVAGFIEPGRAVSATDYHQALRKGFAEARRLCARVIEDPWTLLITPTLGHRAPPIAQVPSFLDPSVDAYTQFVLPIGFAGLPAVSVPAGLADGAPVGVQLVGARGADQLLLDFAEELERDPGFGFIKPPGH